jgi:hypothetical protein
MPSSGMDNCERVSATMPFPPSARRIGLAPDACALIPSADGSITATRLVRITHPFHPLSGKQFNCVGERYNPYGRRLLFQVDDGTICSVLEQWTDLVAPDPEIVLGKNRVLFRVADLLDLSRLVDQLGKGKSATMPGRNVK